MCAKWSRKWIITDNQEVGLEAATLERKRNSSLVEIVCAVNITGLKHTTEAVDFRRGNTNGVVGERSSCDEGAAASSAGAARSENADVSSDKEGEKPSRRKPKGSCPRIIRAGLVGP